MHYYMNTFNYREQAAYCQGRYDINIHSGGRSTDTIPANLIVDSSQRDRSIYENPGHYSFELISPYRDVISVELTQANVPKSFYSIGSDNNKIKFTFDQVTTAGARDATTWTATIPSGSYTSYTTLASEIQTALNNAVDSNGTSIDYTNNGGADDSQFSVTYSSTTGRFTVTAPTDQPFSGGNGTLAHNNVVFLAGQTNNADTIIGLGAVDEDSASSGSTNVLTFSNHAVLNPYRYLVLEIKGMERCDGNSSTLMNSFCVIPLDTASNNFGLLKDGDTIDNDTYIHHFPEPLPKLARMDITIRKPDGNICDFNGRDHFLVFEIRSLVRPRRL